MRIIHTDQLTPNSLNKTEELWVYNGLDCCVTMEVFEQTEPLLDDVTRNTYEFRKELQAPVLEMNIRGIRVDQQKRTEVVAAYKEQLLLIQRQLNRLFAEGIGESFSWSSPTQMKRFFYEVLKLPVIRKRNTNGIYAPTVDRDALEKLSVYFIAQPFILRILALRDIAKKIAVLETEIEADGRLRTSYNISGTETGRFSSSLSEFGLGTNLQNIEKKLREVFIPDDGMKFCEIDLEQAESRAVGAIIWNLFRDPLYLDACESGDLHTTVTKLCWPDLGWTNNLKVDKQIAEEPFYRQHSYRHMAKVLGHGTNYGGTPPTMAKHTHLEIPIIREFQTRYFRSFPGIQKWHAAVARQLATTGQLTTLLGMKRSFFGRLDDAATVRQAIAFEPQSVVGELLNKGLLALWRANICQPLLQIHDAVLFQYPEAEEHSIVPQALSLLVRPVELQHGRTLVIPAEAKVGWNWGPRTPVYDENKQFIRWDNPEGLKTYEPNSSNRGTSLP